MSFREFLNIFEAGGLFITPGPPGPGALHPPRNIDIYLHQYGTGSGGGTPTGPGLFSGPGNSSPPQQPQRKMKKMKKS